MSPSLDTALAIRPSYAAELSGPAASLAFSWPEMPATGWREDFFLGAWHPHSALRVSHADPPAGIQPAIESGRHWMLLSNTVATSGAALVHASAGAIGPDTPRAIAFRGYVVEPPVHSWSAPSEVLRYWSRPRARRHNGVFAAARIDAVRGSLELVVDAFGIAPLYWRRHGEVVLFATNPRFLRCAGDDLDPLAARMFVHRRGLLGDVSLVPGVRRVPPGRVLRFDAAAGAVPVEHEWFPLRDLPTGEEPITERMVCEAEEAFRVAVRRCVRLMPGATAELPLSSGDDSRRILVALREGGTPFRARTVRILQKEHRDLDARFTAQMARELGFEHTVLEHAPPAQYAADDRACRVLMASEITEHTWFAPVVRALGTAPTLVFDGLAGDTLGNTGLGVAGIYALPEEQKIAAIVDGAVSSHATGMLRAGAWASLEAVHAYTAALVGTLPPGPNRSDLAFLLFRARRGTSLSSQHLLPPGQLPVYPYLDLDHATVALRPSPLDKLRQTLQARCLERFWPAYHAYPGSRRLPPDLPPGTSTRSDALLQLRLRQLRSECPPFSLADSLRERLTGRALAAVVAAAASGRVERRIEWWLLPVLMLESYRRHAQPCWSAAPPA